jgi:hypothetical protein
MGLRGMAGNPEGKRPLPRPRHSWESNIEMNLRQYGVVWIGLIRLRGQLRALVNMVMNTPVP